MKTITKQELIERLLNTKGTTIISVEASTNPRLLKTDNPYWDKENKKWNITKLSYVNGMIGWIYTNSVNNQRSREGKSEDFQAHKRRWGKRIKGTPLVDHKGNKYLELKVENHYRTVYLDADGYPVDERDLEPYKQNSKPKSRQGVEKEVVLRDYKIDSIETITLGGEKYKVI